MEYCNGIYYFNIVNIEKIYSKDVSDIFEIREKDIIVLPCINITGVKIFFYISKEHFRSRTQKNFKIWTNPGISLEHFLHLERFFSKQFNCKIFFYMLFEYLAANLTIIVELFLP